MSGGRIHPARPLLLAGVAHQRLQRASVWRLGAGIEPRVYKNFWLGLAHDAIKFNVSANAALFDLHVAGSYRVSGLQFYARLGF